MAPWHRTCGPSSALDKEGLFDQIPHALQSGSPLVLATMEARLETQPEAVYSTMPYLLAKMRVSVCLCRLESYAHSIDKVALKFVACSANRSSRSTSCHGAPNAPESWHE